MFTIMVYVVVYTVACMRTYSQFSLQTKKVENKCDRLSVIEAIEKYRPSTRNYPIHL